MTLAEGTISPTRGKRWPTSEVSQGGQERNTTGHPPQEQEKQDNLRAPNLHIRPFEGIGVRITEETVGINSLKVEETKELPLDLFK